MPLQPRRRPAALLVLCLAALALLLSLPLHAARPGLESRWQRVARVADIPLDGASDITADVVKLNAVLSLPFPVTLGISTYSDVIIGPGYVHLLTAPLPHGDPEVEPTPLDDIPGLGPRIDLLTGARIRVAPRGRVLVHEEPGLVVIRWTALTCPTSSGFATIELAIEPGAITAQYLHVPRGFVDESVHRAAPASASAYQLFDTPTDVTMPFDPPPSAASSDPPPVGCDANPDTWCDYTGSSCTQQAGQGSQTPCSERTSSLWRFREGGFCLDCPYRFYVLVECGRDMHLPTFDMEGLDLEITNMVTGAKPDLRCINDTAKGNGSANRFLSPPSCPGKPGPWWSPPLDVTNNVGPGHVSFSDSTPNNGSCTTQFDVPCSELPTTGVATTVNYGEDQTIDCSINDPLGLCGIYRVDIISGGNGWRLFANCDGTDTPQFDIYHDCTEAWAVYNPLPELAIANVAATGDCWTYDVQFEVQNIGCVNEPDDVLVRITSSCGDSLDITVPGPVPPHGVIPYTQPMTLSCPDGILTFTVDPDDDIPECTESASAAACQTATGIDTLDAPVICCPLVNAGADKAACSGVPVPLADASSQFADTFLWTDGGAGGTFSPSATMRNPSYSPNAALPGPFTLTLRTTYSGSGCFREDALLVTVQPTPVVDAGATQSACVGSAIALSASGGIADQFTWSDAGAGGTFSPSAFVLSPSYTNGVAGTYILSVSGTDVPTGCVGSDSVSVTFNAAPIPDAGVDRQACLCEPVPLADAQAGGATAFAWSDGGAGGTFLPSATVQNPTYMNAGAGLVTLSLQGTDTLTGCVATDPIVIEFVDCPEAEAGAPKDACVDGSATLFDATGGSATTYLWTDSGAGGTFTPSPTTLNATYANATVGTHALELTATDRAADVPVVYQSDFEGSVGPEWSTSTTSLTPYAARRYLGGFSNDIVTLTLTDLPVHDHLALCFDAFVIGSWEGHSPAGANVGPDLFEVMADGSTLLHASFSADAGQGQSYPEVFQDALGAASPTHPAESGADEVDTLGYAAPGDAAYRLAFTFRHSGPTLTLTFRGRNLQAVADESWGIDDLQLSTASCRNCSARDSVMVTINPLPIIDAGADKAACAGTAIALDDNDPGDATSHRWSDGGAGGTFSPNSRVLHPTYTKQQAGNATLTYTGTVLATGCSASDTLEVEVNPAPLVSAGADDTGCAGAAIPLDDAFASSGTTLLWSDGGAGGTFSPGSTILEPSYSNAIAGTYTLTLTATRPSTGCTASDSSLVTVVANPTVDAGVDKTGCAGVAVSLPDSTTSATTVRWSDNGASGTFSPSADVLHPTYTNAAGTYTLTLRATGTGVTACTTDDSLQLTVNALPTVNAGADKEACVAQDVALSDATSSGDSFSWSDGGAGGTFTPSATIRNPSYRNGSAGDHALTLTATISATGCSNTDTLTAHVRNATTASFTLPPSPCEDTAACFTNTSTNGTSWSWTFGDPAGGSSTAFSPCYIYSTPGTYTVTLTSTNACGSNQATQSITVNPKPVANFTFSTQGGRFCKDKDVNFTDTSTNSPTSWSWDFDDGTTSTLRNPVHQFTTDGVFIVKLTACNGCGCGPPIFKAVQIAATCSANCEANSNQINCTGNSPTIASNSCTDHGNFNTASYPCAPGYNYSGENKTYDLNFPSGANFIITLTETEPEPNGYDLDVMISDACNPPNCVAWGDTTVRYSDRTTANDDYWLIVDGRDGSCGPYEITVQCLSPAETASCDAPGFNGIVAADDQNPCVIPGILVTWDAVTDWGAGTSGAACSAGHYEVWRALVSDPNEEAQIGTVASPTTSYLDTETVPRTDYRYRIAAVNDCCAEAALPTTTNDALDDFGNPIDMDAGSGGTITCASPSVQLLGTASGGSGSGFTYAWTPTAGLSDPTVSNPVATIGATYTLTVSDVSDGCSASDTVVVIGDNVLPTANAGPDRIITCADTVVTLAGSASGGNASSGYTYAWTPASGVSNASIAAPTTSTAGTYTLIVTTVATGCIATDSVLVTLSQDPPTANAGPNREITCVAPSVTLQGSASGGNASSGYSYSWSPATGVSNASSATPTTSTAGIYQLTVTAIATGCTDTDVVVVLSNTEPPVASAGPDRQLSCAAGPVTLIGSGFGGDGSQGYTFAWSPADQVSNPSVDRPTTSMPGTYTLIVTDVHTGCTGSDSVVVAPDPNAPTADAGTDQAITCLVATVTLSGSATGGDDSQGYTYAWSPAGSVASPTSPTTTTSTPGIYTLRVTSVADGCVGLDAVTVSDLTGPPATSAGADVNLTCANGSVTLAGSASGSDGRSGYGYSWVPAGLVSDPAIAQPTTSTAGTYTLTATDTFTGCSSSDTVTVGTDTAPPSANAGSDGAIRCNAPSAALSGSASGGNASQGYAHAWSPTAGVESPTSASTTTTVAGTYTLTVTSVANGCTATDTVVISSDTVAPVAEAGSDRVLDCAVGSVTLDGSASGGNGSQGYSFGWEPAANVTSPNTATTNATAAGTYTLTVTDVANGCTDSDTVLVTSTNGPTANAGPDDRITCSVAIADLQGSASSGDGSQGYTYSWSPTAGVANPAAATTTTTIPAAYTLTITDVATGCRAFDVMIVADGTIPPIASAGTDRTITCSAASVVLQGAASGGDGSSGYTYSWTPTAGLSSATSATPTASIPATYTLVVTDVATGCTGSDVVVVVDGRAPPIAAAGADQQRTCAFPTATLSGSASGADGSQGYNYSWTPAAPLSAPTSATTTTTTAGTYTLTVTDVASGCSDSDVVVVSDSLVPPVANAGADGRVTCDAPLAQLSGSASGGDGSLGYDFAWEPAADVSNPVSATPVALAAGTFTLTVTSRASGCSGSDTVIVVDGATPPTASAGADRLLDCSTAIVTLAGSASGGDGSQGYTYAWEPFDEVSDPAIASPTTTTPGIYSLTVTAIASGCTATDSVLVTQDVSLPHSNAGPNRRIDCDTLTATLTGTASGGNSSLGYTHAWSPAGSVANPTSAVTTTTQEGTYTLTVTSVANSCSDTDTVIVTRDGALPTANAGADADLGCNGLPAALNGSGSGGNGSQGYGYSWTPTTGVASPSSAQTTTTQAGTYTLTVTSLANGCTATDTVLVTSGTATPTASAGADQRFDCDTSLLTLMGSASGGDASQGYTYHWEPSSLVSNADIATPTTITTGTYTLTVTSVASGCSGSDTVLITRDVRQPTASAGPDRAVSCGSPFATLEGSASGGNATQGYSYSWSPAASLSDPSSATPMTSTAGTYTLTVTCIATGCSDIDIVLVVSDLAAPTANAGPDRTLTCAMPNVTLAGSASGGNGSLGHAYSWTPAASVSDASAAAPTTTTPGTYTLIVTDLANGCTSADTVTVTQDVAAPSSNAGTDRVLDCSAPSVTLNGSASGGNGSAGYTYHWEPAGATTDPSLAVTQATASGTFTLTVTSVANGCSDDDTVVVTSSLNPPVANAGPDASITCADATGDLQGSASGGNGSMGYETTWSPAAGVADPTALITTTTIPGTYSLVVLDIATGCRSADTVVVADDRNAPTVGAGPDRVLTCATLSVTLNGSASGGLGTSGYSYSWSPASDVANPTSAVTTTTLAGLYTLTATDIASGCSATDEVSVGLDRAPPIANAGADAAVGCTGVAQLNGSVSGGNGSAGASYSWAPATLVSNPSIASPTTTTAGTYTLTVTDLANGCTDTDDVVVVVDTRTPVASAGADQLITCALPAVTLSGSASGGNGSGGYSYSWSPAGDVSDPAAAAPTTSTPGTYTLTVTDSVNLCTATDIVIVTIDQITPTANAGPDQLLDCAVGSVPLTGAASGGNGSAGYSFHWEPAGAVADPDAAVTTASASGTYALTVTALANGCVDTDTVIVNSTQPPPIANAGPDGFVRCDRDATLSGSASGGDGRLGYTAAWSPVAGVANPAAFITTTSIPATYTLTVTDVFTGCRAVDAVVITDDARAPVADAGADQVLTCAASAATLTGSASGGNGSLGYLYAWEPAASVSDPSSAITTTASVGTYTLTVTDRANGCASSDTVTVTAQGLAPIANAGPDAYITCIASVGQLNGSASGGDGSQGYSFRWDPAALLNDPNIASPTARASGLFTLTVTDIATGCTATDTAVVSVDRRRPIANAGSRGSISCAQPEALLDGAAGGGNGTLGYSYSWTPTSGVADPSAASTTTRVAGVYTLLVTDNFNGCTDSDTVTIDDNGAPPLVSAGPDRVLDCDTLSVVLDGSASGGNGSLGYTYAWSPAGGLSNPAIATPTAVLPGTYTLSVTDVATNCTVSDSVDVSRDVRSPLADAGPPSTLSCTQPLVPLIGAASGGNGSLGYVASWSPASGVVDPTALVTQATAAGTYALTLTDLANGCVASDSVVIGTDAGLPLASAGADQVVNCIASVATLTGAASGGNGSAGYTYSWAPASDVSSATTAVTTTTLAGTYVLTVRDTATGCLASDAVIVTAISAPTPPEPSAVDQRPAAPPLRVAWTDASRSQLVLTWENVSAFAYRVHAGFLPIVAGAYDHGQLACGLGAPSYTYSPAAGSVYFLAVAAACDGTESSYGRNTLGTARPDAAAASGFPCP